MLVNAAILNTYMTNSNHIRPKSTVKQIPGSAKQTRRSSAVAERPRDALCLSVVSINSTISRMQSFIIVTLASGLPMRTIKFCSVLGQ